MLLIVVNYDDTMLLEQVITKQSAYNANTSLYHLNIYSEGSTVITQAVGPERGFTIAHW